MPDHHTDFVLVARAEWSARCCALTVALLGVAVLIGWMLDITALKSVVPGWATMKANTALGFLLAGLSLFAASRKPSSSDHGRRVHLVLSAALTLLGLLTLGEYVFTADFGIDQLLVRDTPVPGSTAPPGRMAAATAAGFILTGVALLLLDCHRGRVPSQSAAILGTLIGVLALLGYAYDVPALYGIKAYSSVALHTAAGLAVINFGVLLARPRRGLMGILTSQSAGGVMARRLMPVALVAPFIIGWLRVQGEQRGMYDSAFGVALVALAYVTLFATFIWRTADALHRNDQCRMAAEQARLRQQVQLSGVIDTAMDAIIMVDAARRITLFNAAAERMFGHQAADMLGGPLDILLPQRCGGEHARQLEGFDASDVTSLGGPRAVTGLRADGKEFPADASISRFTSNGEAFFTVVLRDISESQRVQEALQDSEQRYRTLAAGTFEGVLVSDNGRVLDANAQLARMLGYAREELIGRMAVNFLPPEAAVIALANVRVGGESCFEHEILCKDGSRRWVEAHGQTMQLGGRRVRLTAVRDITERKQAEDDLKAAMAEAERANNAKSRFLAAASHDLRQPLSALSIYVGSMASHVMPSGQPMLANMKECIGNLSGLLNDLLDLSKLEAGVVTPNISDFALDEVLASLLSVHTPAAQEKGLTLRCVAFHRMGHTDLVLFKRILGNLIDNAIRYTERGGVLVGCRRRQGKAWVEVWDSGIGIPADKTAEIFEEFKQLGDDARTRGSGLGLAIVAKAADLLGLEIRVRSWPGRGSVFAIELPPGQRCMIPSAASSIVPCRPLRIAFVEDNAMVRDALVHALQDAGHQVVAAVTGAALLEELGSVAPDIVVSDYRLTQGETGYDVISAVRARLGAGLPAILITGDTDPTLMRSMADRGITVLHKPLDLETLHAYLEDLTYVQSS